MERKTTSPKLINISRLVKSEDLNHHGTLFAGRSAEWFVEAGFIAAASMLDPNYLVCLKIHGMQFTKPVRAGAIICLQSKVVYVGKSSLVSHVSVIGDDSQKPLVNGFITFIHVDDNTNPKPHNIELVLESEEDIEIYQVASELKNK